MNGKEPQPQFPAMPDPLQAAKTIGDWIARSGIMSLEKMELGYLIGLDSIISQRSPLITAREYQVIAGKLSLRPEAMLARFNLQGGKVEWISTTTEKAEAKFTWNGSSLTVSVTIDDAKKAGWVRDKGGWQTVPDAMLRARLVSKAIRMLAPEVIQGSTDSEEIEFTPAAALSLGSQQADQVQAQPAEQPKPEAEAPKPKKQKPEQPKPEQPKPEQPKPEAEAPKPEQPKPEQPKPEAEAPKPEQPKPEAEQPKPEQQKPEAEAPKPGRHTVKGKDGALAPESVAALEEAIGEDHAAAALKWLAEKGWIEKTGSLFQLKVARAQAILDNTPSFIKTITK